jgi:hypothetical protein
MKRLFVLLIALVGLILYTNAQENQWVNYTNGDNVRALAIDGNDVWACTNGGLVKIDIQTGNKTFYNPVNSGLPNIKTANISIDNDGCIYRTK